MNTKVLVGRVEVWEGLRRDVDWTRSTGGDLALGGRLGTEVRPEWLARETSLLALPAETATGTATERGDLEGPPVWENGELSPLPVLAWRPRA